MLISDLAIKRPVLAIVLNLLIILAGITSIINLPIREYPDVENPLISVTTIYRGASPETIESTITQVLEEALNGLTDVRTISSKSAFGQSNIDIEFKTSRDIDLAATDVSNAIQAALNKLPTTAEKPVISKSSANSDAIMWISIQGENYSREELSDIADRIIKPQLQVLPGVSAVRIGGQRKYAMRIWLDPKKMAARNIDINDITEVLKNNNLQLPAGQIKGSYRQFNILADGQIDNPKVYENLILKNINNSPVYLRDVGYAELGSSSYDTIARYQGKEIIGVGIVKQSKANELKVAEAVKKELPKIIASLPNDLIIKTVVDRTLYINAALLEVLYSLLTALVLVIFITLIFLKTFTATSIISFAIPISLIGAFAGMYILGFSINVLTMLGMILAIGIVVDDAIVVLENVYRRQEEGESQLNAAVNGSREVAFPVIATTLCLIAVFIPLSFLSGTTGRLFKEFSIAVAIAVGISGLVSLTLTPALGSILLKYSKKHSKLYVLLDDFFKFLASIYEKCLSFSLRHQFLVVLFLILNLVLSFGLYFLIPKTFVPVEDRGYFLVIVKAPQGSTLAYTSKPQLEAENLITKIPEVVRYFSAIGLGIGGPPNPDSGILFANLKHWKDRKVSQQEIVGMLFGQFLQIPQALIFPINPPSLGQQSFGKDLQIVIKGSSNLSDLSKITKNILEKIRTIPGLINVDSDLLINNPEIEIKFNRKLISDSGLSVDDVSMSLQYLFSESKLNDFILRNKQYDVITSLIPKYMSSPRNIKDIFIKDKNGKLISLDNLVELNPTSAPTQINHFDLQRSVTISASLLPFLPLGTALDKVNKIVKDEIKTGLSITYTGITREYIESSYSLYLTFLLAIIFIYLILAATFESFIHPITVLLSVPLALLGSFLTLKFSGQTINIYTQIGMILLIGLVTKNSILLVDYANQRVARGAELVEATINACKIRFRPIIMTSITMIFGTIPLALSHGAGAESRISIGVVVLGGLTFSTLFTLIVIPVIYILICRFFKVYK